MWYESRIILERRTRGSSPKGRRTDNKEKMRYEQENEISQEQLEQIHEE